MKTLPDKASELILLAVEDLEKAEVSPSYTIDMAVWHEPSLDSVGDLKCAVCLAGSVMAFSLDANIEIYAVPYNIADSMEDPSIDRKLRALNDLRSGLINQGLLILEEVSSVKIEDAEITLYSENAEKFKQDMRYLAAKLATHGL